MRYILALVPPKQQQLTYIQTAERAFALINDGYLLTNKSVPHVTLSAFQCEEEKIPEIWQGIKAWEISS